MSDISTSEPECWFECKGKDGTFFVFHGTRIAKLEEYTWVPLVVDYSFRFTKGNRELIVEFRGRPVYVKKIKR